MNFQAFCYVFHVIKWGDILSRDAFLFLVACNKDNRNETKCHTPLIPSEISRENARAWVSMDFK